MSYELSTRGHAATWSTKQQWAREEIAPGVRRAPVVVCVSAWHPAGLSQRFEALRERPR